MVALLILVAPALAEDLSCAQLVDMARTGIPPEAIVSTIEELGVPSDELGCIVEADLPEDVKTAAGRNVLAAGPLKAEEAPPAAAPTPRVPAPELRPDYGPDRAMRTWLREDRCSPYHLLATLPDPGVAMMISGSIGFGTGHFYARQPERGIGFFLGEGIAAAVGAIGYANISNAELLEEEPERGPLIVGSAAFGLLRIADWAMAYQSAQMTREERLMDCGW